MLASLAALQLLVAAPVAAPPPILLAQAEAYEPRGGNPPLPDRADRPPPPPRAPEPFPVDEPPPSGTLPPPRAYPLEPRMLSLLSAEPLRGGSAALAWVGWSSFGAMVAQGFGPEDDLGLLGDFDWAKTELRLGAFYRRPLGQAGPFAMAGRLSLAFFRSFGATYVYDENRRDRGFEVTPGLSLSTRGAGGIFSALADGPITVTTRHGAGLLFAPRVAFAYEAPLYEPYTVGVRAGIGYRAGAGDAPMRDGRAELTLLVLGGARL